MGVLDLTDSWSCPLGEAKGQARSSGPVETVPGDVDGNGYTTPWGAEELLRDASTQIQVRRCQVVRIGLDSLVLLLSRAEDRQIHGLVDEYYTLQVQVQAERNDSSTLTLHQPL